MQLQSGIDQNGDSSASSQPVRELTFSQILNDSPSSPPAEDGPSDAEIMSQFHAQYPSDDVHHQHRRHPQEEFRPSSAQSHTTSASEWSFSSTDVDNDSVMSDAGPQLHARNDQLQGIDLGVMDMEAGSSNQQSYWITPAANASGSQGSNTGAVKTEANWDELRTIAPDSLSPQDANSATGPIRGQSEDPASRINRLERESLSPRMGLNLTS
jgi:hypothetical protein